MSFWKDQALWIYEGGFGVFFLIMAMLIYLTTHDFKHSLFFFLEIFSFMQPFLLVGHFLDRKRRNRNG